MSQFWTEPWAAVEATRRIEIAMEQNIRYLEIGGEPCYLFKRRNQGIPVVNVPTSGTIEPDPTMTGFYRVCIWDTSIRTDEYPKFDTVEVYVDNVKWNKAYDKYAFTVGAQEWTIDEYKDKVDINNVEIPDAVYIILNTPPFNPLQVVTYNYTTIAQRISQESIQPVRVDDKLTGKSVYGYDQYINPNTTVRGRIIPHTFILAFPVYTSDLTIIPAGMQIASLIRHWTLGPPYSPLIDEHDVVVRGSTWKRYEIKNMDQVTHGGLIMQQQFDMQEVNPDAPEYNLTLVTV